MTGRRPALSRKAGPAGLLALATAVATALATALAAATPAAAASGLKLADSFRIGSSGVLCTAQSRVADPALGNMFDRGYRIVCRDAATPVGKLYALRTGGDDPLERLAAARAATSPVTTMCEAPAPAGIAALPAAMLARCRQGDLAWSVYSLADAGTVFVAEGFSGYASALQLALRTIIADAPVAGLVEAAATEAGDPAAFARIQAGSLDPAQALTEGYLRNNAASFAEASEFFDLLVERSRQNSPGFNRSAEYLANQALQQSNLGNSAEADALFARAAAVIDVSDIVVVRLDRNFRVMHELNRRQPQAALVALDRTAAPSIAGLEIDRVATGNIDVPLAQRLNADDAALRGLAGADPRLTPAERATILDAQALYLRGAALRMLGQDAEARAAFSDATTMLDSVRGGRVASSGWLKAGVATEMAIIEERSSQPEAARQSLAAAAAVYRIDFPGSAASLVAEARLAALLARQGRAAESAALYRDIIAASPATPGAGQVIRPLVGPYFGLLVDQGSAAAADFFAASQILVRPGVAQTQAVLARELSGGSDAAAGLFRQSTTLSRDIVRIDAEIARINAKTAADPGDAEVRAGLSSRRDGLAAEQTKLLARLSDFPRYRSVSNAVVTLKDLQDGLRAGEAYYKLVLVGAEAHALFATATDARIFRVGAAPAGLGAMVRDLRETILRFDQNGDAETLAFDAMTARKLYRALFDPVDAAMPAVRHLVFEPDGALLQLPANLLITADTGLAEYQKFFDDDDPRADDMRGLAWLGRSRMVSTAVSPKAFLDVRALPPSRGPRSYLGLGENAPPPAQTPLATRAACDWPLGEWRRPIAAAELRIGETMIGQGTAEVTIRDPFNDTALMARDDLRQFRVIHFATHGLVTAPRPECPARPALLTSFGGDGSDGLLSFREIFDLSLDADTIILSACDTAGAASAAATREAGIATGGNFALDGLVRAFVGAGARAVVASHWPVPDANDATRTLITGLFSNAGQISVGEALRASQIRLMDVVATSHPYYWSGFAIIGDAAKPLSGALPNP